MPPRKTRKQDNFKALLEIAPALDVKTLSQLVISQDDWQEAVTPFLQGETVYPTDPTEFMTDVLGYSMWDKLDVICQSVKNNMQTVVESGFGVGKSITSASIACWFMTTKVPAIVVVVAPTYQQVANIVFRYIRTVGRAAGLPGIIYDTPRWEVSPNHYAVGLSTRRASPEDAATLQGLHGPNVLVIMDEAAGLPRLVWETVLGLVVSSNCRLLAIANPTQQAGPFWEACNNPNWNHIRISCFEHPNVIEGKEVIPGAVSRDWIEKRTEEWAVEVDEGTEGAVKIPWQDKWVLPQPIFQAKVLGMAPELAENQLIRLSWVLDAQANNIDERDADIVIGFDPAPRGGDDNALCIRKGNRVLKLARRKGNDTMELTQWLVQEANEWNASRCYIDDVGVGTGVVDRARQLLGVGVVPVNFGRAAMQRHRFANLRAECWWTVRELLREGRMQLPEDNLLAGDLTAPTYTADLHSRILIESKDEIREKIKRSPDTGDALCLTYAHTMVSTLQNDGEPSHIPVDELKETSIHVHGSAIRHEVSRWRTGRTAVGDTWTRGWRS